VVHVNVPVAGSPVIVQVTMHSGNTRDNITMIPVTRTDLFYSGDNPTTSTTTYPVRSANFMITAQGSWHTYGENEAWLRVRRHWNGQFVDLYALGERQTGSRYGNGGFNYDAPEALVLVDYPPAGVVAYELMGEVKAYCASNDTVTTSIRMRDRGLVCSVQMR
jgi:hypothetical protein